MAVAPVKKILVLGLQADRQKMLELLYDFGQMQLIHMDGAEEQSEALSQLEYRLAGVKFALDFLARYTPKQKQSFRDRLAAMGSQGITVSHEEVAKLLQEFDLAPFIQQVEKLEAEMNNFQSDINRMRAEQLLLTPWSDLSLRLDQKVESAQVRIGTFTEEQLMLLEAAITKEHQAIELQRLPGTDKQVKVYIVSHRSAEAWLQNALIEYNFQEVNLPEHRGTVQEAIAEREKEILRLTSLSETAQAEAVKLSQHTHDLQIIFDGLTWQRDKVAASLNAASQERTFALTGYVPASRSAELEERLHKVSVSATIIELTIAEGEEPPVLLSNTNFVQPFESVTSIYGAPKPNELDPTPYLAPFFIFYFAMCLSDAGYGILLAGFSFLAIKLFKLPRAKQGFYRLLIYAGIATFVVGVAFGGWFGLVLDDLPKNAFTSLLLSLRIIDPVSNPLALLVFSLAIGVVQVIVGVSINLYYQIRQKSWGAAFDAGVWLFLLIGVVFWLVAGQAIKSDILGQIGVYWVYAGLATLVLTQGRRQKNIFLKIPMGILSLYNIVGYFSDVMSYSRLLALGLSTGIIAVVVNMVALLFKDMIPIFGWVVAIGILVGGHLFNLAINALGSFIHSGRLQYVEFFPKFMEGGGSRFKSFARQAKYIDVDTLTQSDLIHNKMDADQDASDPRTVSS